MDFTFVLHANGLNLTKNAVNGMVFIHLARDIEDNGQMQDVFDSACYPVMKTRNDTKTGGFKH